MAPSTASAWREDGSRITWTAARCASPPRDARGSRGYLGLRSPRRLWPADAARDASPRWAPRARANYQTRGQGPWPAKESSLSYSRNGKARKRPASTQSGVSRTAREVLGNNTQDSAGFGIANAI